MRLALLRRAAPAIFFVLSIALWEITARSYAVPSWLLPSPSEIVTKTYEFRSEFPRHILATTLATIFGFIIATVVGIGLALLFATVRILEQTIYPALVAIQSVPKVALAPLFLMWIGYGLTTKIAIVFLVAVFPIVVSATTGLKAVPESLVQMVRAFRASRSVELFQIRLPYAVPYVFVGLRVGITLAATGAVIGEFVGASAGLGYLITVATQQFNTSLAFGAIVLLAILSVVLYYLVDLSQRLMFPWSVKGQQTDRGVV
jgi:NitT/TauT family transport system permease protein